jgi:hypothetical protein
MDDGRQTMDHKSSNHQTTQLLNYSTIELPDRHFI